MIPHLKYSISGLYYNYKKTSNEKIKEFLDTHKIYFEKELGPHEYTDQSMLRLKDKLRTVSLTFDVTEVKTKPAEDLFYWYKFTYLVKSTSRFFLKPDIGEVIDQIPYEILRDDALKGIVLTQGYQELPDTQGEHFLMEAFLIKENEK